MILGVDLDNTLACYDGIFHTEGVRRGLLPPDLPRHKQAVRAYLRSQGRDDDFTLLQGHVYGPGIMEASIYPGALDCLLTLRKRGAAIYIVSHKTRFPYLGPRYDLHESALAWLKARGVFLAVRWEDVFLKTSKEDKIACITELGCTHFIDDLPEFLEHPLFPAQTTRLWFAPNSSEKNRNGHGGMASFENWQSMQTYLENQL